MSTRNEASFSSTDDETKNGNDLLVPEHACMMERSCAAIETVRKQMRVCRSMTGNARTTGDDDGV